MFFFVSAGGLFASVFGGLKRKGKGKFLKKSSVHLLCPGLDLKDGRRFYLLLAWLLTGWFYLSQARKRLSANDASFTCAYFDFTSFTLLGGSELDGARAGLSCRHDGKGRIRKGKERDS